MIPIVVYCCVACLEYRTRMYKLSTVTIHKKLSPGSLVSGWNACSGGACRVASSCKASSHARWAVGTLGAPGGDRSLGPRLGATLASPLTRPHLNSPALFAKQKEIFHPQTTNHQNHLSFWQPNSERTRATLSGRATYLVWWSADRWLSPPPQHPRLPFPSIPD